MSDTQVVGQLKAQSTMETDYYDYEIQSRPLIWSTDVRSTRLYGQFLAGPEQIWHFVSEKARLKVRNARLYGQFSS